MMRASALASASTGVLAVPASLTKEQAMAGLLYNAGVLRAERVIDMVRAFSIADGNEGLGTLLVEAGRPPSMIRRTMFERLRAAGAARIGKG